MRRRSKARTIIVLAVGTLLAASAAMPVEARDGDDLKTVVDLDGPRGVASVSKGHTLVSEADGTFSLVVERKDKAAKVTELGGVPAGFVAPAIDSGKGHRVFALTVGGAPGTGAATLYKWQPWFDEPKVVADIAAYQATDPDPYNLADDPGESNPFGVAALKGGSVLVSDAAANDLLRVSWDGSIETVARLKPRVVEVPEELPDADPDGNPLPPAGTPLPSEGVATSVTVGADGYWYVGELRGFPATPGTSQIWRIKPGSVDAVCDPEHPNRGPCKLYADGLTSIVDLGADRKGNIYAVSLSKMSWLQFELGAAGAEVGGLFKVSNHGKKISELAKDELILPGGADVGSGGRVYVTASVFGPGALSRVT